MIQTKRIPSYWCWNAMTILLLLLLLLMNVTIVNGKIDAKKLSYIEIFISSQIGNDNDGTGTILKPYQTIKHVQTVITNMRKIYTADDIIVNFLEGQYTVQNGIDFHGNNNNNSGGKTIYQAYNNNINVNVSTAYKIPHDCFQKTDIIDMMPSSSTTYVCDLKQYNDLKIIDFKTLRNENGLLPNARYPPGKDDWLFVDAKVNVYKGNNTFLIGISRNQIRSKSIANSKLKNAKVHMFPTLSWINFEASIIEQSQDPLCPTDYKCFLMYTKHCTNTSLSCHIRPGNRFYIYSFIEALSDSGGNGWYLDYEMKQLYISTTIGNNNNNNNNDDDDKLPFTQSQLNVYVPQNDYIFSFQNVQNYEIRNLNLIDVDYISNGFQEGFNILPSSIGMPSDSSIHISQSKNINITNCLFHHLGSGGIHITNQSTNINIVKNTFNKIGQSPIIFTGNTTSQARHCLVQSNLIDGVGEILASAGGVLVSSGSYIHIKENNISNCSRWGIAIRSNDGPNGMSIHNIVELNRLENLGEKTRDLGGLSFIGDGITNTIVKNNCVKNVIGFDTNPNGTILTPFFNWGIYLDNDASGFLVEGNVVNTNVNGGVFFHGGKDNMVRNNIFINCSNHFPKKGRYGYYDAGQSDVGTFLKHHSYNNSFLKNIIWYTNNRSKLISAKTPFNHTLYAYTSDYNLIYSPKFEIDLINNMEITPVGNWKSWISNGYDMHSKLNINPLFLNPHNNDFRLHDESEAFKLGFQKIPDVISYDC